MGQEFKEVRESADILIVGGGIAEAVRKSFPDYFDRIRKLGIEVELTE